MKVTINIDELEKLISAYRMHEKDLKIKDPKDVLLSHKVIFANGVTFEIINR